MNLSVRQELKEFWYFFSQNRGAVIGLYLVFAFVLIPLDLGKGLREGYTLLQPVTVGVALSSIYSSIKKTL